MIDFFQRHPYLLRSAYRRGYERLNPLFFDTLHVNEFPKSGGTWLCRMLRDCLDWRLDDNAYPLPGRAIVKHHRRQFRLSPTITVIRDPRDVALSYYYHCRKTFQSNGFNHRIVKLMNDRVFDGCADKRAEMQAFVRMITQEPISPGFTWGQFYAAPDREGTVMVRYEDMRADPAATLARLFQEIGQDVPDARIAQVADAHAIEKVLEKRKEPEGAHFIRKGKVGGWRDELDEASAKLIEQDAGPLMAKYGYS